MFIEVKLSKIFSQMIGISRVNFITQLCGEQENFAEKWDRVMILYQNLQDIIAYVDSFCMNDWLVSSTSANLICFCTLANRKFQLVQNKKKKKKLQQICYDDVHKYIFILYMEQMHLIWLQILIFFLLIFYGYRIFKKKFQKFFFLPVHCALQIPLSTRNCQGI